LEKGLAQEGGHFRSRANHQGSMVITSEGNHLGRFQRRKLSGLLSNTVK